jgi:UDP-2,3-diacylglucosamine pyrophosphatase LpxH
LKLFTKEKGEYIIDNESKDVKKNKLNPSSIIVISDTHFGRGVGDQYSDQPELLVKFLEWIEKNREVNLKSEGKKTVICFPKVIILLGDIFEFWAPLSEKLILNRSYMFIDKVLEIKNKGCKIIYVIGNHDTIMRRYEGNLISGNLVDIKIVHKYEEIISSPGKNTKFVFVHGDQFEWGATNGISTKIMGYIYRIVSDLTLMGKLGVCLSFGALLLMLWNYYSRIQSIVFLREFLFGLLGALGLYAIPSFIYGMGLLVIAIKAIIKPIPTSLKRLELDDNRSNNNGPIMRRFRIYKEQWNKSTRAKIFHRKPRYKKLEEVVNGSIRTLYYSLEKWWNKNYAKETELSKPDVIVFGHTHTPEGPAYVKDISRKKEINEKLRQTVLVNTGCWIKERTDEIPTFLYIDKNGEIMLCEFDAEKGIGIERGNLENPLCS